MGKFTVRVELHRAQPADYDALHAAMEERGFSRMITADTGQTYRMPWAEYDGSSNLSCVQVRDIARAAANATGKDNAVLVTEAQTRAWVGLQRQF